MIAEVWENEDGYPFDINYCVKMNNRKMPISREHFAREWLDKNKIVHYWPPYGTLHFREDRDRLLFIMRWS